MAGTNRPPLLELFVFETLNMVEQLEQLVLDNEKNSSLEQQINEAFRLMHTIKGSAAMMLFNTISTVAHAAEDVFYFVRETKPQQVSFSELADHVLGVLDFIKEEIGKIQEGREADGEAEPIVQKIGNFLSELKECNNGNVTAIKTDDSIANSKFYISPKLDSSVQEKVCYEARVFFEEDCGMENVRAFTLVHSLSDIAAEIACFPDDFLENNDTCEIIQKDGFKVRFNSDKPREEIQRVLEQTMFLKSLILEPASNDVLTNSRFRTIQLEEYSSECSEINKGNGSSAEKEAAVPGGQQSFISVHVAKMDELLDIVGELVISEAMVTRHPELNELPLDGFHKAARQLRKIINELQDVVMSIRMVPLAMTFQKMNRVVRDMNRKLGKEVCLEIIGEATEVDKNIIEHISDPIMHIIRNSLDHGIESAEERLAQGKPREGKVTLEAKSAGRDVWIIIRDDGRGLDKTKILSKARERGMLSKPEKDMTDKEIYSLIFSPGFSTKEKVTEFSGRGVGMDVVTRNVQTVGGSVSIDSSPGQGTEICIKIPLTLAIMDGMIIKAGEANYTIPTVAIKESFRVKEADIIRDTGNNEMLMVRGKCYPVIRLSRRYGIRTDIVEIEDGIMIMIEDGNKSACLFVDRLLGEQPVVVKALPGYIKKVKGLAGCTLLGDGSISLIVDVAGLIN